MLGKRFGLVVTTAAAILGLDRGHTPRRPNPLC